MTIPIGHLVGDACGAIAFVYSPAHVALTMQLHCHSTTGPGDVAARAYFDNLLPERDTARTEIVAKYGLAKDDVASILSP